MEPATQPTSKSQPTLDPLTDMRLYAPGFDAACHRRWRFPTDLECKVHPSDWDGGCCPGSQWATRAASFGALHM